MAWAKLALSPVLTTPLARLSPAVPDTTVGTRSYRFLSFTASSSDIVKAGLTRLPGQHLIHLGPIHAGRSGWAFRFGTAEAQALAGHHD